MSKRKAAEIVSSKADNVDKSVRTRLPVQRLDMSTAANDKKASKEGCVGGIKVTVYEEKQPLPSRQSNGDLIFSDHPEFVPNLTPKDILQLGSFGGTYFRPIYSGVTKQNYKDCWKEFPEDWFTGLDINKQVASSSYSTKVNTYGVSCGGDLHMWESSGWISEADPYGWFQWYCRFYLGRRSSDDTRQISRGNGVINSTGRWRNNLINKCLAPGRPLKDVVDDKKISPKVRQLLQHWGYKLTLLDLEKAAKKMVGKSK